MEHSWGGHGCGVALAQGALGSEGPAAEVAGLIRTKVGNLANPGIQSVEARLTVQVGHVRQAGVSVVKPTFLCAYSRPFVISSELGKDGGTLCTESFQPRRGGWEGPCLLQSCAGSAGIHPGHVQLHQENDTNKKCFCASKPRPRMVSDPRGFARTEQGFSSS